MIFWTISIFSKDTLNIIPENWSKLSELEKWQKFYSIAKLYKELDTDYIELRKRYKKKSDLSDEKDLLLDDYENIIKRHKSFYPKFAFGLTALAGVDTELRADVYTGLDFYIFFLRGRIALTPSANIKIYDKLGGGIGIGLLFLF